jgi:lipoprotein-anchoring transpeptidase ErfK/SrfK
MHPTERAQFANKLIVVERDRFKLTLYRRKPDLVEAEVALRYQVAIGTRFHRTPKMMSIVDTKDASPSWTMPNSDWVRDAGLVPGTVLDDDDPNNPIKARWIGISNPGNGIGIHGTADDESIGKKASHGCIRMHVWDVEELFSAVPLGTLVYID